VELKDGIDGLVHISQISEERIEKVKDVLKPGQEVTARVIKIDREERRLGLSIKAANYSERSSRPRPRPTRRSTAAPATT
jgi:small subunit ribosomal protein S1